MLTADKEAFEGLPAFKTDREKGSGPHGDPPLRDLHRVFLTAVWRICDSVEVWGTKRGDSGAVSADWPYQPGSRGQGPRRGPPSPQHIHRGDER